MNIIIKPSIARGSVSAPPSKSMAHRLLIAAGLSTGKSRINGVDFSQDILATIDCLRSIGASITIDQQQNCIDIIGVDPRSLSADTVLRCRESGSTMRFMIPLVLLSDRTVKLIGEGRLMERPMTIYSDICREQNLQFEQKSDGIYLRGPLHAGKFCIPGDVSSQFITGLLYALPTLEEDSEIRLTTPLESKPYIDLTLSALKAAGIIIEMNDDDSFYIRGNQRYKAITATVEGDYSNAAFLEALNLLGGQLTVTGLSEDSFQGDRVYRTYFRDMQEGMPELNIHNCPDLAPILMTMGAALHGVHLKGTRRLKIKESDRGVVMAQELKKFGANISLFDDEIIVQPSGLHKPAQTLQGHNDHRIVMSLAVLATKYGAEIADSQAVNKSFPSFFDVLSSVDIDVSTNATDTDV